MSLMEACKATPMYVSLSACSKISDEVPAEDVGVRQPGVNQASCNITQP